MPTTQRSDTWPSDASFGSWGHSPHWHEQDKLLLAVSGSCLLRVEGQTVEVGSGYAVYVRRGVVHSARFGSGFVPCVRYLGQPLEATPPTVRLLLPVPVSHRILAEDLDDGAGHSAEHTDRDIAEMVVRQMHSAGAVGRPLCGQLTAPIAQALRSDPSDSRTLQDWAGQLHCSISSLLRAFRVEAGTSYTTWRSSFRIEQSLVDLERGRPVNAIARSLGMTSNGYAQAFRRHFGVTPTEFRHGDHPATLVS